VNRLSLPTAAEALAVTGYPRGTITPFGSATALPVVADASIVGARVSMGGGEPGLAIALAADDLIAALAAEVADITQRVGSGREPD
jgi:prolyl-tRNA editing enzyme YbaK/EbsC (Cys-tRNA(Pro) deacylase)